MIEATHLPHFSWKVPYPCLPINSYSFLYLTPFTVIISSCHHLGEYLQVSEPVISCVVGMHSKIKKHQFPALFQVLTLL